MKNLFQNRAVGFWLDLAGTVLTLVGIILYALYAADTGSNKRTATTPFAQRTTPAPRRC